MNITLYSKPHCVQCDATKRSLNKAGLTYTTVDVSKDAEALERIIGMGFQQAPVVEVDGVVYDEQHRDGIKPIRAWSGFRPDLISQIVQ